jgi:hypothetical protein
MVPEHWTVCNAWVNRSRHLIDPAKKPMAGCPNNRDMMRGQGPRFDAENDGAFSRRVNRLRASGRARRGSKEVVHGRRNTVELLRSVQAMGRVRIGAVRMCEEALDLANSLVWFDVGSRFLAQEQRRVQTDWTNSTAPELDCARRVRASTPAARRNRDEMPLSKFWPSTNPVLSGSRHATRETSSPD